MWWAVHTVLSGEGDFCLGGGGESQVSHPLYETPLFCIPCPSLAFGMQEDAWGKKCLFPVCFPACEKGGTEACDWG